MPLKGHKYLPRKPLPRSVILDLKRSVAVVGDLLTQEERRVLLAREWLSQPGGQDGPLHLTSKGWAGIQGSDQAVRNRRSAAALEAGRRDPYEVASNARRVRRQWRARHEAPSFRDQVAEWLENISSQGPGAAVEGQRDPLPVDGADLRVLRALGPHGLLATYDVENALVGPTDATGTLQQQVHKWSRRAWKLLGRGLVRAVHVQAGEGGTITIRLEPSTSGAQVLAAATTI